MKSKELVQCSFTTLDEFATEQGISFIDILKMDVQGAETLVLDGGKRLLESRRIGLVYTEIITMPTYERQKPLWEVLKMLEDFGMCLHNIYNLNLTQGPEGRLRQVDVIFVCESHS